MTTIAQHDAEQQLREQVERARSQDSPVAIQGGNTKAFYGNPVQTEATLACCEHQGVIAYEPTELAITLRCGTPLALVESLLADSGQEFAFEPPHFGAAATIGGMVAAGLSGPRRPYAASVRDSMLGVRLLNGEAKVMNFGGRVMKNVAGYDVSRLMAGSLGVLGVILEVSLKVVPKPPGCITLVQEQNLADALGLLQRLAGQALPITGTAWCDHRLLIRIAGSDEALAETQRIIGGTPMPSADADRFWHDLREQTLDACAGEQILWRVSVPPATPADAIPGVTLVEWGGALRWLRSDSDRVRNLAAAAGGHATQFRAGQQFQSDDAQSGLPVDGVFASLDPVAMRLHRNLKQAFDPAGILNPGRLYPWLGQPSSQAG